MAKFDCDACGDCCRMFGSMPNHAFKVMYDRGDGTCKHLDDETNKCKIYLNRPKICCVDKVYDEFIADSSLPIAKTTRKEFHELNHQACEQIRKKVHERK